MTQYARRVKGQAPTSPDHGGPITIKNGRKARGFSAQPPRVGTRQAYTQGAGFRSPKRQDRRPFKGLKASDTLTTPLVADLLGISPSDAGAWIARHCRRLKAWESDITSSDGPWRVTFGRFQRACLQLGVQLG